MGNSELRLEKLRIHERLGEVEKSQARVESRLFENGILDSMSKIIVKLDNHVERCDREYGKIRGIQDAQKLILRLFSVLTLGLLVKMFF